MRILLKCPTRSRPHKIISTLSAYMKLVNHPEQLGVAISCDENDETMSRNLVHEELHRLLSKTAWHRIFTSQNTSKIEACNANMNEIDWEWDIVVLVSDDMLPQMKGYDDVIRNHMMARHPDTNGILWFNDGYQGDKLNTLTIMGRKMYDHFGYLYHPEYKSLFCDTEFTDLCTGDLKDKCTYVNSCIIRHEHPGTGYAQNMDALYQHNQRFWNEDMYTYIRRKKYSYDITFMIPTIQGREESLRNLMSSIHEKMGRLASHLHYTIDLAFDNREMSIGMKREHLVQNSKGKYSAFIDDDDDITDEYIEDLVETIRGSYPVMRLRGRIDPYTFTHSVAISLDSPMAIGEVFVRPPNHLNPIMTDVAKLVHYGDVVRGEDFDWAFRMAKSGFLTQEYSSDDNRIHYIYTMGLSRVGGGALASQQQTSYQTMLSTVLMSNGVRMSVPEPQPQPQQQGLRLTPRGFVSK
jgi:hypothetical protein